MAYCPECGAEFGGGIRRCPECRVDLLDELDEPTLYDNSDENLVLIRESATPDEAARIKEVLGKHGILSVVEEVTQAKGRAAPGKTHVLVNQKDEARSQELLKGQFG
ncbi:MAG: hypothetical protein L0387_15310 [Acidobacteria bacterium]|nr:hypothetical protein [Acidobacteriota bacterium]MCI0717491.1 hypothetical protein [Acidobacteriota bacterium]